MDDRDKWRIAQNHDSLTADLPTVEICNKLRDGPLCLFTQADSERIEHRETSLERNEKLLDILRTKGPKAYETFRSSLLDLKVGHLVEKLDNTDVTAFVDEPEVRMSEITRAAVGRLAKIGDLYDATTDTFVGKTLLKSSVKDLDVRVSHTSGAPSIELVRIKSLKDKMSKLKIDYDLRASILLDMVPKEGYGNFLKFTDKSFDKSLIYRVTREKHRFDLTKHKDMIDVSAVNASDAPRATHVVVGIDWGAVCCIASKSGNQSEITDGFKVIEKALRGPAKGSSLDKIIEWPLDCDSAAFQFFLDVPLPDFDKPVTAERAVEIAKFIREGKFAPVKFQLVSLEDVLENCKLKVSMKPFFNELDNEEFVDKLTRRIEKFETMLFDLEATRDKLHQFARFINDKDLKEIDELVSQLCNDKKIAELRRIVETKRTTKEFGERSECDEELENHLQKCVPTLEQKNSGGYKKEIFRNALQMIAFAIKCEKLNVLCLDKFEVQTVPINKSREVYVLHKSETCADSKTESFFFRYRAHNSADAEKSFLVVHEYVNPEVKESKIEVYIEGSKADKDFFDTKGIDADIDMCLIKHQRQDCEDPHTPQPRAHVYVKCPNSKCSGKAVLWGCYSCKRVVEHGMSDKKLHCQCGIAEPSESEFRCNSNEHDLSYVRYTPKELEAELKALQRFDETNILLLGETGVGKSTWINSVYNYWTFDSVIDAMESEELKFLVPFRFPHPGFTDTQFGKSSEDESLKPSASGTQAPKTYVFYRPYEKIRLIDTPGINDTEGAEKDEINVNKILYHLRSYADIHSICIMFKSGEARVNEPFKKCVKQLLSNLHKKARENVMFVITHVKYGETSACGENAALTLESLNKCLSDIGESLKATDANTFYFDNEPFRFLARIRNPDLRRSDSIVKENDRSWEMGNEQLQEMLKRVKELKPHDVENTILLNKTRALTTEICCALIKILGTIQENIARLEEKQKTLHTEGNSVESSTDFQSLLNYVGMDVEIQALSHRTVVCTHQNCLTKTDRGPGQADEDCYTQVCHDPCDCWLLFSPSGLRFHTFGAVCSQMRRGLFLTEECNQCSHTYDWHMPLWYKHTTVRKSFINDEELKRIITEEGALVDKLKVASSVIRQLLEEFEKEKDEILAALVVISLFLEDNSLVMFNDPVESVLTRKPEGDGMEVQHIIALRKQYFEMRQKKKNKRLRRSWLAVAIWGKTETTAGDAMRAILKLFSLKRFGDHVKKAHDIALQIYHSYNERGYEVDEIPVYMQK